MITKFQGTQALCAAKCPPKSTSFPEPQSVTSLGNEVVRGAISMYSVLQCHRTGAPARREERGHTEDTGSGRSCAVTVCQLAPEPQAHGLRERPPAAPSPQGTGASQSTGGAPLSSCGGALPASASRPRCHETPPSLGAAAGPEEGDGPSSVNTGLWRVPSGVQTASRNGRGPREDLPSAPAGFADAVRGPRLSI